LFFVCTFQRLKEISQHGSVDNGQDITTKIKKPVVL